MNLSKRLSLLTLTTALLGASLPASADVITTLDQCLADPSKTQAVFSERFPHETCKIGTTCDPNLVQSAQTLARERCRTSAIDSCTGGPDPATCTQDLTDRWQGKARDTRSDIEARLEKLDPAKMSRFAIRRFGDRLNFELTTTCPDLTRFEAQVLLEDDALCGLYSGFVNVSRMEGLSNYLADQEARQ